MAAWPQVTAPLLDSTKGAAPTFRFLPQCCTPLPTMCWFDERGGETERWPHGPKSPRLSSTLPKALLRPFDFCRSAARLCPPCAGSMSGEGKRSDGRMAPSHRASPRLYQRRCSDLSIFAAVLHAFAHHVRVR